MKLKLVELLEERRVSQTELADGIGKTRQAVSAWIVGRSWPDPDQLEQICLYLDCELTDIMEVDRSKATRSGKTYRSFGHRFVA